MLEVLHGLLLLGMRYASVRFFHIADDIQSQKAIKEYNPEGYLFIQESRTVISPNTINELTIN